MGILLAKYKICRSGIITKINSIWLCDLPIIVFFRSFTGDIKFHVILCQNLSEKKKNRTKGPDLIIDENK